MKSFYLSLSILFSVFQFLTFAQTNDSPISAYDWKGKKTVLKDGYIVLKSDKRLDGQISLKGSVSSVTHVQFIGDGKDIEFPVAALKSYGVVSASGETVQVKKVALPASTKDLFQWRTTNEAEGRVTENTKPRSGYVILLDGNRLDGEIQLRRLNGNFREIKLKTEDDKYKFEPNEVQDYGLSLTINELTKNGEKTYKDASKNFHEGKVVMVSGSELSGLVAFSEKYQTSIGDTYGDVMFASNVQSIVKTFKDSEIKYATQMIDGEEVKYTLFEGGFVSSTEMDNAEFKDVFRMLNPGTMTLKDGTVLQGDIARNSKFEASFKNSEGVYKLYPSSEIKRIDVSFNDAPAALINVEDHLIEEVFNGNTFLVYINPKPTHINSFRTSMAKNAMSLGSSALGAAASNATDKEHGVESNVDSVIMNSSTERLESILNELYSAAGVSDHQAFQESSAPDFLKSYEASIAVAVAGRKASNDIVVYYRETIVMNKTSNEKYVLYNEKKVADDQLEGLLMGCYTFLELEKNEQKEYYKLKNIKKTAELLDSCY